jgi:hypothetical protein
MSGEAQTSDSTTQAVEQLGTVLAELEIKPDSIPLLQQQVSLMKTLSMTSEVLDCISRLSSLVMLSPGGWLWGVIC